jgi:hypothetical protein
LYEAIHISQSKKNPIFDWHSQAVSDAYTFEMAADWSKYYDLIASPKNISILVYSGEYDLTDGPVTMEPWLRLLNMFKANSGAIWNQPRKIYYLKDGEQVGGYYRADPSLRFILMTVPKTGHFVPTYQLNVTQLFLQDMIDFGSLSCHREKPEDCDTGPIMCEYNKGCSGHGTCSNATGKCTCQKGYYGTDCSDSIIELADGYT